uniref:Response regulator receiver modulated diguanylate cyclase n=1 Tax=uncultured bacterium contig00024 TaxID=1181513 RepID=A0A806JYJ7_9BACT|nr:response regulator receiver modulated diguanylate cyclase [uncultured bacterium contig00024]
MDIKERLEKIPELNLKNLLPGMDEKQLDDYVKLLNEFADHFPVKEKEIKSLLDKKDTETVTEHVKELEKLLTGIHADDLAEECAKHVNNFKNLSIDRITTYVNYLLSTLAALSIDLQVAIIVDEKMHAPVSTNKIKIILAVDDDAFCLDQLKIALSDVQCNLIGATTGGTALNMLRKYKPDLFVLDIDMPGMDGIELAEKIRSLGHKAPIVFITGNADKGYVLKAINAGGADFIVKPINQGNVVGRLKKFL